MNNRKKLWLAIMALGAVIACGSQSHLIAQASQPVGLFESHGDVGTVLHPGSAEFDSAKGTYTLAASGENMWSKADAFQFVWKKLTGDVAVSADISFVGTGGNPHRKAVVMLRQSLDPDSVYADVALHGSGLTALQFRDSKGETTREIQSNVSAPKRIRIVKRGDYVYMAVATDSGNLQMAGGWLRISLTGDFYVGIGLCAHDKDVVEKAVFSNVNVEALSPPIATNQPKLYSTLETIAISSPTAMSSTLRPNALKRPTGLRMGLRSSSTAMATFSACP